MHYCNSGYSNTGFDPAPTQGDLRKMLVEPLKTLGLADYNRYAYKKVMHYLIYKYPLTAISLTGPEYNEPGGRTYYAVNTGRLSVTFQVPIYKRKRNRAPGKTWQRYLKNNNTLVFIKMESITIHFEAVKYPNSWL